MTPDQGDQTMGADPIALARQIRSLEDDEIQFGADEDRGLDLCWVKEGDANVIYGDMVCMETNLARMPVFVAPGRRQVRHDDWQNVGWAWNQPVLVREPLGRLTVSDLALAAYGMRIYTNDGCPDHGSVIVSLGDAARFMGCRHKGGRQRELAREALARLAATEFRATVYHKGTYPERRWSILTSTTPMPDGQLLQFDPTLVALEGQLRHLPPSRPSSRIVGSRSTRRTPVDLGGES